MRMRDEGDDDVCFPIMISYLFLGYFLFSFTGLDTSPVSV